MSQHRTEGFAAKHDAKAVVDPSIKAEFESRISDNELPCAMAFDVAKALGASPEAVGKAADLMNLRLVKCQLGLFGYGPGKKIVKAQSCDDEPLAAAIRDAVSGDRLSCQQVWEIAARFKLHKLMVSGVCEGMKLRIKPCQLGAF